MFSVLLAKSLYFPSFSFQAGKWVLKNCHNIFEEWGMFVCVEEGGVSLDRLLHPIRVMKGK